MARRILVVDDEEDIREILHLVLEKQGYSVELAADGQEGLDLIDRRPPDLIILDLKMPRFSGYRLFAQLKSDSRLRTIPVIIVTALTQDSDVDDTEWARRMGAEAFLTKPFDLDELSQRVAEMAARLV